MSKDNNYEGVLLEHLDGKLDQLLEATAGVPGQLRSIADRLDNIERQVELIPTIMAAVKDVSHEQTDQAVELRKHAARIARLQAAA